MNYYYYFINIDYSSLRILCLYITLSSKQRHNFVLGHTGINNDELSLLVVLFFFYSSFISSPSR